MMMHGDDGCNIKLTMIQLVAGHFACLHIIQCSHIAETGVSAALPAHQLAGARAFRAQPLARLTRPRAVVPTDCVVQSADHGVARLGALLLV